MLRLCEIDLKKDLKLIRKLLLGRKKIRLVYISNSKQDFVGQLLENKMATLKETFGLWVCEGLEFFNTLLQFLLKMNKFLSRLPKWTLKWS